MNFRTLLAAAAFMGLATGAALAQNAYTTANVNMRAGPSTQYPAVTTLPDGAAVDVHGCTTGWSWCDTTWRGIRGWVSGRYLQMLYNDRRVYLPDYAPRIGIPIITFQFGNYWDRWYRDRPWYRERDRWRPVRPDYGPPRPPRPGAGAPPPPPPGWDRPRPPRPGAGAPPPPPQGWDRPRPPRPGAGAPPPPPPGVDRPRPPRPGAGAPPPPPPGVDRPRPPRPQAEDDNRRRTGTISQGGNRTRQRGCPNGAGPDGCL